MKTSLHSPMFSIAFPCKFQLLQQPGTPASASSAQQADCPTSLCSNRKTSPGRKFIVGLPLDSPGVVSLSSRMAVLHCLLFRA